ncbi:hypothetical protein SCP_1005290 [Sparassis crispa]|uniref:Uncharacterized protein n=1 Tax=Sparassis crispa TaxID=139825 RepID=A0A401GYQ0_9APHY|nr:hypothetical protein SCP_1005290 [Sparassis crispa]GBE87282.1 hypothetical protein SCP_1005290 [Sparassis crispa]
MATSIFKGSMRDPFPHSNFCLSLHLMANIPIDPVLLREEASVNPPSVLDLITEIQANNSTAPATPPSHASSPDPEEEDQAQEHLSEDQPHGTRRTREEYEGENTRYGERLDAVEFGQHLKRLRNLTPHSESELARFAESPHLLQHTMYTYGLLLECRDYLQKLSRDSEYKIPDTLRATLTDYAHTYILSPTIESYRKASNPGNILAAMRHLNIAQIPPEQETGRCAIICTVVVKGLTEWRNHVKTQISISIDAKSTIRNLAALAHACIKTCSVRPTIAMYIRLAYIRLIFVKFSGLKEDAFWNKVDSSMKEIREHAYQAVYRNDKLTYGEPDNAMYPIALATSIPAFINDLNAASNSRGNE